MTEEFLQYVWANSLFTSTVCVSTKGKRVEILNVGFQNRDAGPDFFNAKVRINDVVQVGNVEIHQKGSDWFRHAHEKDSAYNNVILSVVGEADMEVYDSRGREIDAITLVYDNRLWDEYVFMQGVPVEPRCHRHLKKIDSTRLEMLFTGYAIERLERKCKDIQVMLRETKNDWEECFSMEIYADSSDSFSHGSSGLAGLFDDAFQFLAFQRAGCLGRVGNLWFTGRNRLFLLGYSL